MGIYKIGVVEFEEKFEKFLKTFEGEVDADVVADSWNKIGKRNFWSDTLKAEFKEE